MSCDYLGFWEVIFIVIHGDVFCCKPVIWVYNLQQMSKETKDHLFEDESDWLFPVASLSVCNFAPTKVKNNFEWWY